MSLDFPNYSPDSTLTAEQHHVLALLADGRSLTAAAEESGIHRNTVRNWRRSVPAFAREFERALREQAQAWHDRTVELAPRALEVLEGILDDAAASPALRLRAALVILKTAASPQLEALPSVQSSNNASESAWDRYLARNSASAPAEASPDMDVHRAQTEESCTILHNAPIRRAPEPGRNSLCPCGSGLKFKRCCASYAPGRTAAPLTAPAAA